MDFDFVVNPEGLIEVITSDKRSILVHALADSLGTRPPRGAPQDGPSTYWIDRAVTQLHERIVDHQMEPIASGNATYMTLVGESVEVRYDYDPPDSPYVDRIDPAELLELLTEWRRRTIAESANAETRVPSQREGIPLPRPE